MLSHNNWEEQIKKYEPQKQRFTIKKLSVGVASILLGVTFAAGTASADSTTANADSASNSGSAKQTDHNLTLNSASASTLKTAIAESQSNSASAASQNPAGDVKTPVANNYEAAVSAAVASASNDVASEAATSSAAATQTFKINSNAPAVDASMLASNKIDWSGVANSLGQLASRALGGSNSNDQNAPQATGTDNSADYSNYKTVTNEWDLQNALSDYSVSGVNIKGNITPFGDLNINRAFTIHGVDGAALNLGQNKIVNNGQLTLADVTVNGSVMGNGIVNIKGTVNSNVNEANSATLTNDQLTQQIGSSWVGANINNWKSANIFASRVNIEQGAALNINRSIVGDGIALTGGAASFQYDGSTFGSTRPTNDLGTVSVGVNSKLNINLKDANYASRSNESNVSLDNASSGVRAADNGHFVTGDSAQVTINTGHGRAINFGEPFGGNTVIHGNSPLTNWYNNRNIRRTANDYQDVNNSIVLGDSTKMNITGRDGILFGNRGSFVTGNHSIVHIDGKGNGAGLLGDAFSTVEVSPQSQLILTSDGKDSSGMYAGGNFIGLGENGQFRVEHDAVFRYRLTNRGGSNPYDDNMNIISINSDAKPEVYVGNNATFDGQSDYKDFYGEIFSFPLGSTSTVFQIDGAKYVNWEKNALVTGHGNQGNLYYSMGKGLIDASGKSYYIFKWDNGNLNDGNITFNDKTSEDIKNSINGFINSSDKWWSGITGLATSYSQKGNLSEWPGHVVSGNDITGENTTDHKTGTSVNKFSASPSNDTGFDPLNSQRLVLVATTIPTQEDETSQTVQQYDVKVRYNKDLQPGQVKLVQEGHDGLTRTTTTHYYIVDPATGKKTLDTSKGDNGVSTTVNVISQAQDAIIEVGPQTATVDYYYQGGNATNNAQPIFVNGQQLKAEITASPVVTENGNLVFDKDGKVVASTIQYNDANDILIGRQQVSRNTNLPLNKVEVLNNTWETAVNNGTNKYLVGGATRDSIIRAAERAGLNNAVSLLPTEGPNYRVTIGCDDWKDKTGQLTVNFIDEETGNAITDPDTSLSMSLQYITNQNGVSYNGRPNVFKNGEKISLQPGQWDDRNGNFTYGYVNLPDLSSRGYELTHIDPASAQRGNEVGGVTTSFAKNYNATINVYYKHGIKDGNPESKTVTRTIEYRYENGSQAAETKTQTANFTSTVKVDAVTGHVVSETWTPSQTFDSVDSPEIKGYTPDKKTVSAVTVDHNSSDMNVVVIYNANKANADVTYIDDTTGETLTTKSLEGKIGEHNNYSTQPTINDYVSQGYELVSDNYPTNGVTFTADPQHYQVHLKHGLEDVNKNNPHDMKVTAMVTRNVKYTVNGAASSQLPSKTESTDFSATGHWDKVLHKLVDVVNGNIVVENGQVKNGSLTWTPDQANLNGYDAPSLDGYHVDSVSATSSGQNVTNANVENSGQVKAITVDHNSSDIDVLVNLVNNGTETKNEKIIPASMTVKYQGAGEKTPANNVQNGVTFHYTGDVYDTYTGKKLSDGHWEVNGVNGDNHQFNAVTSPEVEGYHPDVQVVPGFNATPNNPTLETTVTYTVNGTELVNQRTIDTSATVHYEGAGDKTPADNVQNGFKFEYSGDTKDKVTGKIVEQGTWNADSHAYNTVNVPEVEGYHAEVTVVPASELTVTRNNPNVTVTVKYVKNGTTVVNAQDVPASQKVIFVDEDGNTLNPEKDASFNFNYSGDTKDDVTGAIVKQGTWNATSYDFASVNVPVIDGYVAVSGYTKDGDNYTAGGFTTTPEATDAQRNRVFKVVYKHVGKIVPVMPDQIPIPNAPTPQYPNNPTDPTKVTPNEPVPDIPSYTPSTPTVTPTDPTKDTPVVYTQNDASLKVEYFDQTDNKVLNTVPVDGKMGDKITYTTADAIKGYENQGYVLVNDGFTGVVGNEFTDANNGKTYRVTLKHGTEPVNPGHPAGGYTKTDLENDLTRTIKYVNAQTGAEVANSVAQPLHFEAAGTVDKVTGKLVTVDAEGNITGPGSLTWTPAQTLDGVKSPAVKGMHVSYVSRDTDGTNVASVTLNHTDHSYDVIVNYVDNGTKTENGQNIPASQTVKFVDDEGNTLRANDVQTSDFVRTPDVIDATTGEVIINGAWNETSHKFGTINVPVIPGYVTDVKTAGGLTATTENPNVVTEVVYHKVGKIVPVTPDNKPIPNTPTPEYPNDPTDPTKVTPNEPVPDIPGYTPEVPTVTPENPTKDTPVVYTPVDNTQNARVRYIDLDENDKLLATSGNLTGQPGDRINYSTASEIKDLENKGYVLVNDGFPTDAAFDNDKDHDQVFTVTFRHGHQPVNPENPGNPGEPINPNNPEGPKYPADSDQVTANVTRTIQYVDENGDSLNPSVEQPVHFTADGVLDKVTGQWIKPLTWSTDQAVPGVNTPVVEGYHVVNVTPAKDADGYNIKGVTLTHTDKDYTVTVIYAKNGKIVPVTPDNKPIPNAPTPQYPTSPDNPATVVPNEPVPNVPGYTPEVSTVTPKDDTSVIEKSAQPAIKVKAKILPQTGNDSNDSAAVLRLAALGLSGLLIAGKPGRRRHKKD